MTFPYLRIRWAGNVPSDTPKHRNKNKRKRPVGGSLFLPAALWNRQVDEPGVIRRILSDVYPGIWLGGYYVEPSPDFSKAALPAHAESLRYRGFAKAPQPIITYEVIVTYAEQWRVNTRIENIPPRLIHAVINVWERSGSVLYIDQHRRHQCQECLRWVTPYAMDREYSEGKVWCYECTSHMFRNITDFKLGEGYE